MRTLSLPLFLLITLIVSLACNLGSPVGEPGATATDTAADQATPDSLGTAFAVLTVTAGSVSATATDTPLPAATATVTPNPPSATPQPSNTPIPSATNTSAPVLPEWPILRNGDQGPNVYALQYLLKYHGQNLTADGIFGNQTRTAVMNFQTQKGLAADGQAGPLTFSELIKIGIVRSGQSGDQVRALQHLLSAKYGYTLAVDGVFGSQTDSAVKDFQGSKGLAVDGLVGPQTWQTLIGGNP